MVFTEIAKPSPGLIQKKLSRSLAFSKIANRPSPGLYQDHLHASDCILQGPHPVTSNCHSLLFYSTKWIILFSLRRYDCSMVFPPAVCVVLVFTVVLNTSLSKSLALANGVPKTEEVGFGQGLAGVEAEAYAKQQPQKFLLEHGTFLQRKTQQDGKVRMRRSLASGNADVERITNVTTSQAILAASSSTQDIIRHLTTMSMKTVFKDNNVTLHPTIDYNGSNTAALLTQDGNKLNKALSNTPAPVKECTMQTENGQSFGGNFSFSTNNTDTNVEPCLEIMQEAESLLEYKVGEMIHLYLPPLVIPAGLVGNVLSFLVMLQPHNRRRSTCLYMGALAVSDTVLLGVFLHFWISISFTDGIPNIVCKVWAFHAHFSSLFGATLLMAMTVDRYIAVCFPLHAAKLCSTFRAKMVIGIGAVFFIAFNIPVTFMSSVVNKKFCVSFTTTDLASVIYSWSYIAFCSVIPFSVLLAFNILIISSLQKYRKNTASLCEGSRQVDSRGKQASSKGISRGAPGACKKSPRTVELQLTAMLMLVTFTFLLLTLPQYIRYIIYMFLDYKTQAHDYAVFMLLYHVSNKLWFTNR